MKVLNSKEVKQMNKRPMQIVAAGADYEDKHPCYHADADRSTDVVEWKVGVSGSENDEEFSFKVKKGDPLWDSVDGAEFAIKLLEQFKAGGGVGVSSWIANGCP